MSDNTLTVRDHTKPCQHLGKSSTVGKVFEINGVWFHDDQNACPGGREIVLRQTTLKDHTVHPDDTMYVEVSDE